MENMPRLLSIMARLRRPEDGCPWDVEQDFTTIAPHTIEEAYEVADAIARGDMAGLKDELGDLLFQVVFHARMAEEAGAFDFADVVDGICDKMRRRHPHVFGDAHVADAAAQTRAWEVHKAREREAQAKDKESRISLLDGVTLGIPALLRAVKLQRRAAGGGFDWPDPAPVLDKINEEMAELARELVVRQAVAEAGAEKANQVRVEEEFGDLLFAYANLARHLDICPETALRHANTKFERRFRWIEDYLDDDGKRPGDVDLATLERLWNRAKNEERHDETP